MPPNTQPWRPWRVTFLGLSLRAVARATNIEPWRLSLIERGVPAPPDEETRLRAYFADLTAKVMK